ncbi:hypothetical protein [Streptomyces sp. NBC_01571]|uniref:hypothetical protein n=1 Tax=Streptomyces sp. NBC_01571 TaxID=2975883 RepID=UPI00338D6B34
MIRQKWLSIGREQYGYPLTDESPCPDGHGRFHHFRAMQLQDRPGASIYWTPQIGAAAVYGESAPSGLSTTGKTIRLVSTRG